MDEVTILGKTYPISRSDSELDSFQLINDRFVIKSSRKDSTFLLDQALNKILYEEAFKVYDRIRGSNKVGIIGNLDFEIVDKIDKKENRIAKMKGNKILIKKTVVNFSNPILEYIIAHEIAHIASKRHTKKFWKMVELICPDYEKARESLNGFVKEKNRTHQTGINNI